MDQSSHLESLNRLMSIHIMIGEARFCLEYSVSAPEGDREKFWLLGIKVLENMNNQLNDLLEQLQALDNGC